MDYWKSKVMPKIKSVLDKNGKKSAAAKLISSFDESKEEINKEFEEEKADLHPKVLEIYEAAPEQIKTLVKERKLSGIKKNSAAVTKFIEELANIDFPGAKQVSEAAAKVGPALLSGPIFATFHKVATFLPTTAEEAPKEAPAAEEAVSRDIAVEEEEKEEAPAADAAATEAPAITEVATEAAPTAKDSPAEPEPAKTEEEPPKA